MAKVSNEPIRVLQVGMHDQLGGVETFLMNYYRNIESEKVQFDFINPYDKLCFEDEIKTLGGKVYNVPNFKRNPLGYLKELKKIIKQNKYTIIHINMLSAANILPIIAAKSCHVKHIIVHAHNNETPKNIVRKILHKINKKYIINNATDFFACSDLAGKWMYNNKEFTVINNAIDITKFIFNKEARNKIRKQLNIENKFVIGHIGRFSEQKNHEFLVDIYKSIKDSCNNAILLLIGSGELEEHIKNKVKELGLDNSVMFLGNKYNANEYIQAMDVFLLPSKFEGLGIVLIEAQMSGLKCFASKDVIPESASINNGVKFIELNNNPEIWSKEIIKYQNTKRIQNVYDERYDIKKQANTLMNKYIDFTK